MRVVCKGSGPSTLDYDLVVGQAQGPVRVEIETGVERVICAAFSSGVVKDGSNGKAFVARDAGTESACPLPWWGAGVSQVRKSDTCRSGRFARCSPVRFSLATLALDL